MIKLSDVIDIETWRGLSDPLFCGAPHLEADIHPDNSNPVYVTRKSAMLTGVLLNHTSQVLEKALALFATGDLPGNPRLGQYLKACGEDFSFLRLLATQPTAITGNEALAMAAFLGSVEWPQHITNKPPVSVPLVEGVFLGVAFSVAADTPTEIDPGVWGLVQKLMKYGSIGFSTVIRFMVRGEAHPEGLPVRYYTRELPDDLAGRFQTLSVISKRRVLESMHVFSDVSVMPSDNEFCKELTRHVSAAESI